ncbi:MAG TPA: fluoride efflux transporter CrcB [Propionibacteriaceae bacterium]
MLVVVLICVAGGLGASLRLVVDGVIKSRVLSSYPVATTVINISGSLLLGLLAGLTARQFLPHSWYLVAGTGLLGGYTTFSTASFETVRLLEDRRYLAAAINGFGTLLAGTGAAALGFLMAMALP